MSGRVAILSSQDPVLMSISLRTEDKAAGSWSFLACIYRRVIPYITLAGYNSSVTVECLRWELCSDTAPLVGVNATSPQFLVSVTHAQSLASRHSELRLQVGRAVGKSQFLEQLQAERPSDGIRRGGGGAMGKGTHALRESLDHQMRLIMSKPTSLNYTVTVWSFASVNMRETSRIWDVSGSLSFHYNRFPVTTHLHLVA
jgi:hypothetical protein